MSELVWQLLADEICAYPQPVHVAGGCINRCAVLTLRQSGKRVFAKINMADKLLMFEQETIGLIKLGKAEGVRVPEVFNSGIVGKFAFLILEYLPLERGKPNQFRRLGEQLALQHQSVSSTDQFGWPHQNFIGTTPQPNTWTDNWAIFFAEQRIGYQLELAAHNGHPFSRGEQLVAQISDLLAGHEPRPSLLHGDLWSGNVGFTRPGTPVIYDPACYYGDRETDIAFSEMFGGFDPEFYIGYHGAYPLDNGYEQRRDLYNLYHVLNHFNLFGGHYGEQAEAMIRKLLMEF